MFKKTKGLAFLMAAAMCVTTAGSVKAQTLKVSGEGAGETAYEMSSTTDLAIANDEKLIEMLKKKGTISKKATPEQAEKQLKEYLKSIGKKNNSNPQALSDKEQQGLKKYQKDASKKGIISSSKKSTKKVANAKSNAEGDNVTRDKALVLLIQYPDFSHNSIQHGETDMYYSDYSNQHFSDMIFGKNGYAGPTGQNLISMQQFYDQQSGSTYDIEGTVLGWYTAKKPAAYYGKHTAGGDNDANPRELIQEALTDAVADKGEDFLSQFDLKDPYDLDGDGDINEPDGIIDHLMVIHSGIGEEAGGGSLGDNAIWSHSSKVYTVVDGAAEPWQIPGTKLSAYPYTIEPEDGAAGVFAHEFGHDLGLPDEYDTAYSGQGEPIEYWSIMSSGSWSGLVPGTEPSGFSPWAKEYFQKTYGGNWLHGTTVDYKDLTSSGTSLVLDQASVKGHNNDYVRVNLPKKATDINNPAQGTYEYYSGKGNGLDNSMTIPNVDLTGKTSAQLTFKAWYKIEEGWDYGSVQVKDPATGKWTSIAGNITTTSDPNQQNPGNGITGDSHGWVDASFDLSAYAGNKVDVKINYWTDVAEIYQGLYVDDIKLNVDGSTVFADDAEGEPKLTLEGFTKDLGKTYTDQYYLVEWRTHAATDAGLGHIKRGNSVMSYDPGMLVWYVDNSFTDNKTGVIGGHPGDGYLGLVDADQGIKYWSDGTVGATRYQLNDAAFSLKKSSPMFLDYGTRTITDNDTFMHPIFNDANSFMNSELPDAGRNIPKLGVKIYVTGEAKDRSTGTILLKK